MPDSPDGTLRDWDDISDHYTDAILVGNGASIAISRKFAYDSLFDAAPLRDGDRDLFNALETSNFEQVLDALRIARIVDRTAGYNTSDLRRQYQRVRRSLVHAVAGIHIAWEDVPSSTLKEIRDSLSHFRTVFSTNYDLLIYWAIMAEQDTSFVDFFWGTGRRFDLADATAWGNPTQIFYLHGGIHLVRDTDGAARKRVSAGRNLLRAFAAANDVPLFVSEGVAADKMQAIRRSDYLSSGYESLVNESETLVVFGHSLGPQDRHIRTALRHVTNLATSIRPRSSTAIIRDKARYIGKFPGKQIEFFDSTSHPLGDPAHTVP
jgi:hypothetical protein